jgi:hypothetical protein
MFGRLTSLVKKSAASTATRGILAAAAMAAIPATAFAGHDGFRGNDRGDYRRYDGRGYHNGGGGFVGISIGGGSYCPPPPICAPAPVVVVPQTFCPPQVCEERVWLDPVYRTVCDKHWCEPVYRTVCDRVWIEPVTRTEYERQWIPDRFEWRNVDTYANGHRYVERQSVLVEAAHWGDVPHTVIITPGRYEDRPRQELVSAGHFETTEHQELVSAGHWEVRPVAYAVPAPPPARYEQTRVSVGVRFPL